MLCNLKLVFRGHPILYRFEFCREKLDDLAALGTDHVIVMLMFVIVFVVGAAVSETHFARESGFSQYFKGAIDSSLADRRVFLLDELIEILIREVVFSAEENAQNEVALGRAFQPVFLNVFEKYFLLFC